MPTYIVRWIVGAAVAVAGVAMLSTLWRDPTSIGDVRRALASLYALEWADGETYTLSRLPYETDPQGRRRQLRSTRDVVAEAVSGGRAVMVTTDFRYMVVTSPNSADTMSGSPSQYNPGSAKWVRVY